MPAKWVQFAPCSPCNPLKVSDCVHGTYLVHWPFIKRQGLSKVLSSCVGGQEGI